MFNLTNLRIKKKKAFSHIATIKNVESQFEGCHLKAPIPPYLEVGDCDFFGGHIPLSFLIWYPAGNPGSSTGKETTCNAWDPNSIPGWGRSPGGDHGNPPRYSCLENPHGHRSLAGCSPRSVKELDMPEKLGTAHSTTGTPGWICMRYWSVHLFAWRFNNF